MLMWAMSDRAIPRSLRMIEGFGVHTFRLVDAQGQVDLRQVPLAAEARRRVGGLGRGGEDQRRRSRLPPPRPVRGDRKRRLSRVRVLRSRRSTRRRPTSFDFDVLDPTKLIPEEIIPLEVIGKMVLDRNPDNFFAETEQAAFHPGNVVPGIDFTNDPLLQGRLFSYTDTQLIRLGGPNFHEIADQPPAVPDAQLPARRHHAPWRVPTGRVAYEPNSLDPGGPREEPATAASAPSRRRTRGRTGRQAARCGRKASPTTTARRACSSAR